MDHNCAPLARTQLLPDTAPPQRDLQNRRHADRRKRPACEMRAPKAVYSFQNSAQFPGAAGMPAGETSACKLFGRNKVVAITGSLLHRSPTGQQRGGGKFLTQTTPRQFKRVPRGRRRRARQLTGSGCRVCYELDVFFLSFSWSADVRRVMDRLDNGRVGLHGV